MENNRNKPCKCGSGKKYKKCCFLPDLAEKAERERKWKEEKVKRARERLEEMRKDSETFILSKSNNINSMMFIGAALGLSMYPQKNKF